MPTTNIADSTIGRVDVGKISDAIKLADDDAGDPNMNKMQVSISRCTGLFWIKILTGKRIPVMPSKYK